MFVQFADATEKVVVACFGNAQDPTVWPNQGTVDLSDARYATFFNSLPAEAQTGLPSPTAA